MSAGPGEALFLWLLLAAILAALAVFLGFAGARIRQAWKDASRRARVLWAAGLLALIASSWLLTSGAAARAGRHNEHSFSYLSSRAFESPDLRGLFAECEVSPRVLLSLHELAAGRSLVGVLLLQRALWLLCGLLIFLALRKTGVNAWGAAAGGLLFFVNFNAVLLARSFTLEAWGLVFLLSGVYALACLDAEIEPRRAARAFAWLCSAAVLAMTAKPDYSFLLGLGLLALLLCGRAKALRAALASSSGPRTLALSAGGAAVLMQVLWLCAILTRWHEKLAPLEWPSLAHFFARAASNLHYQVLLANLGELAASFNGAAGSFLILGLAPAALALWAWRRPRSPGAFWAPLLLVWIAAVAHLYVPLTLYPASHFRHHLAVFAPFALLFGALAGLAVEAKTPWAPRLLKRGLLAALLALYAFANKARIAARQGDWRTSDLEWQFLLDSRKDWPADCAAVYPFQDFRRAVLEKYFPRPGTDTACLLVYRSPRPQIFGFLDQPPEEFPYAGLEAWRENSFAHRYYTDWHGPWEWDKLEALGPLPVTIGFYKIGLGDWRRLAAAASAPRGFRGETWSSPPPRMTPFWRKAEDMPGDLSYENSLEACYKRRLSYGLPALECFDAALAAARARGDGDDELSLLASRAALLQGQGRLKKARADLAAGLGLAERRGVQESRGLFALRWARRWAGALDRP